MANNHIVSMGDRIRERRTQVKGLTQAILGSRVGVDQSTVSDWEKGKAIPGADLLGRIATELRTSTRYLLDETQDPSPDPPCTKLDRPSWVEDLRVSVTEVSRETAAAILHQEERFVASMEVIGAQLERRDDRQEERDRRQEMRDNRTDTLLQGLLGALERNTEQLARNAEVISRLEARLLDATGPPGGEATEEERQTQWQTRGIRLQGRTQSEGGVAG